MTGKAQPFRTEGDLVAPEIKEFDLDYGWFDLVGNLGVLLMVVAYLLLQLEKLSSSAVSYLLLNAVGAVLVIISLSFRFNLSAFLMEAFWLLISLYGLTKPLFHRRTSS
ncbi:MAG TPA: hypothetical protein VMZ30_00845 [Pyrinomonadaceae bacterium]|nr:hypothetical protein [Pyrinomonadaceae bacterium]